MITPVIRRGLVFWVHPWRLKEYPEESYLMLGDYGFYCPVLFETMLEHSYNRAWAKEGRP